MTKITKAFTVEDYVTIDCENLEAFRHQIDNWIKRYGSNAFFTFEPHRYYDDDVLVIKAVREETDEEYAIRMKRNEEQRLSQEEKDRKEYERLKAKFGE
jgi:hypothetical protein